MANHRDRAGGSGHDVVLIYEASSASNTVTNAAAPHSHPLAPALRLTRRSSLYSMECDVKRMYQFVAVSAFSISSLLRVSSFSRGSLMEGQTLFALSSSARLSTKEQQQTRRKQQ